MLLFRLKRYIKANIKTKHVAKIPYINSISVLTYGYYRVPDAEYITYDSSKHILKYDNFTGGNEHKFVDINYKWSNGHVIYEKKDNKSTLVIKMPTRHILFAQVGNSKMFMRSIPKKDYLCKYCYYFDNNVLDEKLLEFVITFVCYNAERFKLSPFREYIIHNDKYTVYRRN